MSVPMPYLEGVRHRDVEAAGVRFHVAEAGAGEPVVLLHGWPQHWWMWRGVIGPLATERRVICPDLRGLGWSDAPPGEYAKQTFADDLIALLDELGLDEVDLVAHDWGAWAGFIAAIDRPDRIRRYLALNIYPPWPDPPSPAAATGLWRLWYQVVLATPILGTALLRHTRFVGRMVTTGAANPDVWRPEDVESYVAVLRERARAAASVSIYRTFLLRELRPYLAGAFRGRRLTVPTLLVHGTRDFAIDHRRLGEWEKWADEMSVELRDDSAHFIAEELPELVVARARALFAGASPAETVAASDRVASR